MCGIAGFVQSEPGADPAIARRMTAIITHRGPDSCGHLDRPHVSMGMRRLSIVDLAGGDQPIPNEDSSRWIVYNGEIFNHADVRTTLERAGHRYRTHSDTETLLHAFEEYGPASLEQFRGMFAFAIWNDADRSLFIARDRLGIKPLYYYFDGTLFVFGSEIKAVLQHPAVSASFETSQLGEYLAFGFTSGEQTMFRGIHQLMPGHHLWLRFQPDGSLQLDIRRYWDVPASTGVEQSDANWIADCRKRLEETVRLRLMSDVPLGMFLSGGVDSSAIAALIRRMVDGPVKTFSVGYEEAAYSELGYAGQVARYLGTDHHETRVSSEQFFGALPKLIWHEDKPICWPSSVSLYFVSKLAREHVTVVLTGEGSDELFGGYERYRLQQFNQRWADRYGMVPRSLRQVIRQQLESNSLLSGSLRRKALHTFLGRSNSIESLFLDNFYCSFSQEQQAALLRGSDNGRPSPYENFLKFWKQAPAGASPLDQMLYADKKTYLVELLMKQDRMSMACSIESRVPFLDHHFVAFAGEVPAHLKIRGATQKYILKKAVEDLLPAEIIYRKKMGFPTPIRQWFRSPVGEKQLERLWDPNGLVANYLNVPAVRALADRHRSGSEDATDRLWRLLNLQIWGEVFLQGKTPPLS
jgi:asparagine synthase (glutamine-hydrolysing)